MNQRIGSSNPGGAPRLHGIDHTARPTFALAETVHFYGELMGLRLVHAVSARGWGAEAHPDFLHFFFDSGAGTSIAFFYYLDAPHRLPVDRGRPWPQDHLADATHVAWLVESSDELQQWKQRLEAAGVEVSQRVEHEVIESIYFRDPNGYFLEITRKKRDVAEIDRADAAATIEAALALEAMASARGEPIGSVDAIWREKGRRLAASLAPRS